MPILEKMLNTLFSVINQCVFISGKFRFKEIRLVLSFSISHKFQFLYICFIFFIVLLYVLISDFFFIETNITEMRNTLAAIN